MCNKIDNMNEKEQFSLAVRTLSKKGFSNELIANLLYASRKQVGAVMAWYKNRASWG